LEKGEVTTLVQLSENQGSWGVRGGTFPQKGDDVCESGHWQNDWSCRGRKREYSSNRPGQKPGTCVNTGGKAGGHRGVNPRFQREGREKLEKIKKGWETI